MIFFVAVAGHITTIHSVSSAIFNLLTQPDQLEILRSDWSRISTAVDELQRFDPAAQVGTFRFTTDELPVGDVVIPAGQMLALSWASANRDPNHYSGDPDVLDLNRSPVGNMAFGHGVHRCIGVPLAKMQIEVAVNKLFTRYPDVSLALAPEEVQRETSALLRGIIALPVTLHDKEKS
jgi:cytochrome P450